MLNNLNHGSEPDQPGIRSMTLFRKSTGRAPHSVRASSRRDMRRLLGVAGQFIGDGERQLVGRADELRLFERILTGHQETPTVLLISGPPGVGKRTVLDAFRTATLERDAVYCGPICDLTRAKDLGEVLVELVDGLGAPAASFAQFRSTVRKQRELAQGKTPWYARAAETADESATELNKVAPHWSTGGVKIATGLVRGAVNWFDDAGRHRVVTDEFLRGLRSLVVGKRDRLVLLFDGLDRHHLDPVVRWIRMELPRQVATLPVTLVMSAENGDSVYDDLRSTGAGVERLPLKSFELEETDEFIRRVLRIDPHSRLGREIAEQSGSLPGWLGRLRAYFDEHGAPDPSGGLTSDARLAASGNAAAQFHRLLDDPQQRRLVLFSSPLRWFNSTLLCAVATIAGSTEGEDGRPSAVDTLLDMGTRPHWIKPLGGGWTIDPAPQRRALIDELRRVHPEAYWELHRTAERYHRDRVLLLERRDQQQNGHQPPLAGGQHADDAFPSLERRWNRFSDPEYVEEVTEWLYHVLALSPSVGFRMIVDEVTDALIHGSEEIATRLTDIGPELPLGSERALCLRELAAVASAQSASRFDEMSGILDRVRNMTTPSRAAAGSFAFLHGYALYSSGRADDALEALTLAEQLFAGLRPELAERGIMRVRAFSLTWLAWVSAELEPTESAALEYLDTASRLVGEVADEYLVAEVKRCRALVLEKLDAGEPAEIEQLLQDALESYRHTGRLKDVAFVLRTRAGIRLGLSRVDDARADLLTARRLSQQLGDSADEADTVLALLRLALSQDEQNAADELRDETLSLRPADAGLRNRLGLEYFNARRWEEAAHLFDTAYAVQADPVFQSNRGDARWRAGNQEEGLRDTAAAYAEAPEFELGTMLAGRYRELGRSDSEDARNLRKELVRLVQKRLRAAQQRTPALRVDVIPPRVQKALLQVIEVADAEDVLELLRLSAEQYPDDVDGYLELVEAAIESCPEDPQVHYLHGMTLRSQTVNRLEKNGLMQTVADAFRRAWELEPTRDQADGESHRVRYATALAEALIDRRDWNAAEEAVRSALAEDSSDKSALSLQRRLQTLRRRDFYGGATGEPSRRPVVVEVAPDLQPLVDPATSGSSDLFEQALPRLREYVKQATGVVVPGILFRVDIGLAESHVRVLLHGVNRLEFELRDDYLAAATSDDLDGGRTPDARLPWSGQSAVFIKAAEADRLCARRVPVWDRLGAILASLVTILIVERGSLVGLELTAARLVELGDTPPQADLAGLTAVMRRLIARGVSVGELDRIRVALANRGDRLLETVAEDLAPTLPKVDAKSAAERYARTPGACSSSETASIVVRLASDILVSGSLKPVLAAIGGTVARALGLPEPSVRLERAYQLANGQYEIVVGGAVRVAAAISPLTLKWLRDHPVGGPRGRTGLAPEIEPDMQQIPDEIRIAHDLEETLWHDPGLLLDSSQASEWQRHRLTIGGVQEDSIEAGSTLLRELVAKRVPLTDNELPQRLRRACDQARRSESMRATPRCSEVTVERRQPYAAIPDDFPLGIRDSVQVHREGVVDRLTLNVEIEHPYLEEVRIRLSAPSGAQVTVLDPGFTGDQRMHFDSGDEGVLRLLVGEPAQGTWILHVQDTVEKDAGVLVAWSLEIQTSKDGPDDAIPGMAIELAQPIQRGLRARWWPWRYIAAERLAADLRPYEVHLAVGSQVLVGADPEQAQERLADMIIERGLWPRGVGFPKQAFTVVVDESLEAAGYAVVINGLPRAQARLPHPAPSDDDAWLLPLVGCVANCLHEASHELLDLAWTQGFLENTQRTSPLLVDSVRREVPDEVIAFVISSLPASEIGEYDDRLLDCMLDYVACAPDSALLDAGPVEPPWVERGLEDSVAVDERLHNAARLESCDEPPGADCLSPPALVQHVRLALRDRLAGYAATQPWRAAAELEAALEQRLREAISGAPPGSPAIYRVPEAPSLLRQLESWLSNAEAASDAVVVTASDLRRHLRQLVAAQFPSLAVIARDEAPGRALTETAQLTEIHS
jgi:subtilisin-like proprotein convertase family protein/tetratricopeptide (TPR) repeat protein